MQRFHLESVPQATLAFSRSPSTTRGSSALESTVRYEIRPRSFGELLDGSFKLYRDHFKAFVLIAAVTVPPTGLLLYTHLSLAARVEEAVSSHAGFGDVWTLLALMLLAVPVLFVAATVQHAALTMAIANAYLGQPVSAAGCLRRAGSALGSLVAGAILYTLGFAFGIVFLVPAVFFLVRGAILLSLVSIFGMFLCLIPGILFLLNRVFYVPAIMVEGKGYSEAFARSKALVRGQRQRLGLMLLVVLMIQLGLGVGLGSMVPYLVQKIPLLGAFVNQIPQLLLAPIAPAFVALAYFDARVRKEGFDLEVLSREAFGAEPISLGPAR